MKVATLPQDSRATSANGRSWKISVRTRPSTPWTVVHLAGAEFLEELARWYDVKKGIEGPETDQSKFRTIKLVGGKESPLGYGPPPVIMLSRSIADWVKESANEDAWKEVMAKSNGEVKTDVFEAGVDFSMGDFALYKIGQPSVAKLRRLGFNSFVATTERDFEIYQDMAKLGVIPPPVVETAKPMI